MCCTELLAVVSLDSLVPAIVRACAWFAGDEADYCSKNVPEWRAGGMRSGADFMKEMASIAAKHGKKAVLWDDTMGQPLLGQDGVVVQWWHAPHELPPLVKKVRRAFI